MPATNLSFAKVVATPTATSWSQAYNAGGLFIVLSLSSDDPQLQTDIPALGKQLLSNIEAEFFALEDKSYETIKQTLPQALKDVPEALTLSLSLAFIKENALYGYLLSGGRLTLKRGEKLGTILHLDQTDSREVVSASGYLETDDLILLQTAQFAQSVPAKTITQAFEFSLPNDIAETISPHIHGGTEGGASAIIISFKGVTKSLPGSLSSDASEAEEEIIPASIHHSTPPIPTLSPVSHTYQPQAARLLPLLLSKLPSWPKVRLPRQKKLALGLTVLLAGILLVSIVFVLSSRQESKNQALFTQIYSSAKKDYDEGEGLLSLNKSLARDDYKAAKTTLEKARDKFTPNSKEGQQLSELEAQVDKRLTETEGSKAASSQELTEEDAAKVLVALKQDSKLITSTFDEDAVYTLSSTAIHKIPTTSEKSEELVKNDSDWSKAVSLGVFSGNLYVLDQAEGLLKFVPTSDGYSLATYFKGSAPDLKTAKSMAIDGSIYVLFADGSVQKYTRGEKDSFAVSGVEQALTSPLSIYTSEEVDSLYLLDPGTNRIVKLDKSGVFQEQFQSDILKNAKALIISDNEQTASVLSNGKLYSLSL